MAIGARTRVPGRVLVTGGAGFIGSHVAEHLHSLGWAVEALDSLSTGEPANLPAGVPLHVADIRSDNELRDILRPGHFSCVVHCAAQTSVERSMKDPDTDYAVNAGGTRAMLAAAAAAGVQRFVFISSGGAIYGETSEPATESTPPAPQSYYGRHKLAAEDAVLTSGLSAAILRPSNVYGSRQRSDAEGGVIAIFLEKLLAGDPLEVHGSGRQLRDFVYVADVVSAVEVALDSADQVLWNVASGQATSILTLAEVMSSVLGRRLNIRKAQRRAGDVQKSMLSVEKLLSTGVWGPPLTLADGLRAMVDSLAPAG